MRRFLALALGVLTGGCAATFDARLEDAPSALVRDCAAWYAALDRAVDEAGVRDAQYIPVAGFPYLRTDRLFASLRDRAARTSAGLQAYAERLGELDLEARGHEILNLPRSSVDQLPGMGPTFTRDFALRRTRDCGRLLREIDLAKPEARAALVRRPEVPDDYSLFARALGLYPLVRLVFAGGVRRWEEDTRAAFQAQAEDAGIRYAPTTVPLLPRAVVAGLLERANFDPLGQPLLSERELAAVAAVHAPSFQVPVAADYDRFGALRWRRGAELPEVDASQLVVYVHPAYARYRDRLLLQLVYTIWFPERPARAAVDFLSGHLDGIIWRVTLAPDGEPLLYDSIHPCGCYHQFFPTPRARVRPAPDVLEEWAFIPQGLPRVAEGERPVVKLASGTHRVEGIELVRGIDSLVRYQLRSYEELRSMPRLDGGRRSAFAPDGRVPGSERAERFFLWPSGIASVGAMRQWGRHATAFVGRRHFDDADLIERRFELDLAGNAR